MNTNVPDLEWMENVTYNELAVGQTARLLRTVTLEDIQAFAAVSGDINPAHLNAEYADATMFDGVIAHGMLTMGIAAAALEEWLGDPGRIRSLGTRFSRPVPVPDPGEVALTVTGKVGAVHDDGTLRVDLGVTVDGRAVLAKCQAVVEPPVGR